MKVNAVNFAAGKISPATLGKKNKSKLTPMKYENSIKMVDVIPISSLIGASLASVYLFKKGNLDVAMKAIRI